jgi:hypothetical protein
MKSIEYRQLARRGSLATGEKPEELAPSDIAFYRNLVPRKNRGNGGVLFRGLAAMINTKDRSKTGKAFSFFFRRLQGKGMHTFRRSCVTYNHAQTRRLWYLLEASERQRRI